MASNRRGFEANGGGQAERGESSADAHPSPVRLRFPRRLYDSFLCARETAMKIRSEGRLSPSPPPSTSGEAPLIEVPGLPGPGEGTLSEEPPPTSAETETETEIERETVLGKLWAHGKLSAEEVMEMSSQRSFFGVAWMTLCLHRRKRIEGDEMMFRKIDFSGRGKCSRRLPQLLLFLPASVEEVLFGPNEANGPNLSVVCSFLQRIEALGGDMEGKSGGAGPRLRSLTFAERSIGALEAPQVFSVLPSSIETLCLKGNLIGTEGLSALGEPLCVGGKTTRTAALVSLQSLDLRGTGVDGESVLGFFEGLEKEKGPLQLERLMLGEGRGERGGGHCRGVWGGSVLSVFLKRGFLPSLKVFLLEGGRLSPCGLKTLASALRGGELESLRELLLEDLCLDLEGSDRGDGNFEGDDGCDGESEEESDMYLEGWEEFACALQSSCVPSLETLSLKDTKLEGRAAAALIAALCSSGQAEGGEEKKCSLQSVHLCVCLGSEVEAAEMLGKGVVSKHGSLNVQIGGTAAVAFLNGGTSFDQTALDLDVSVESEGEEQDASVVSALADALCSGRLKALRKLKLRLEGGEGVVRVCGAFGSVEFPFLQELDLERQNVGDSQMALLAEGVKKGNLVAVRSVNMEGNSFNEEGVRTFFDAVQDSQKERGLPSLQCLTLSRNNVGGGLTSLAAALESGKLLCLVELFLRSCNIDDGCLGALAGALGAGCASRLRVLDLSGKEFGRKGIGALFEVVCRGGVGCLESLDLSETPSVGENAAALVGALQSGHLQNLVTLSLCDCGIDDAVIRRLGEVFGRADKSSSALRSISLMNNLIETEGLVAFLDALRPESLCRLQKLDLYGNGIDEEEAAEMLQQARRGGKLRDLLVPSILDT